jgi:hypothetical protein
MAMQIRCMDKGHQGELWTLHLESDQALLCDPYSVIQGAYGPEEAVLRFQMPSFSESIKYFGVRLDDRLVQFAVERNDLKEIKRFINQTIVGAGPEAVESVKRKAIRDTLVGIACAIGGCVLTIGSYLAAATSPVGGNYYVTWGLVLFGFIMVGKGLFGFKQYSDLLKMSSKNS